MENLLIDIICYTAIFPNTEALHLVVEEDKEDVSNHSIIFLEAENHELIRYLPISLFINIASMQEMDLLMINKYFDSMRTSTVESYFYCVNREEKLCQMEVSFVLMTILGKHQKLRMDAVLMTYVLGIKNTLLQPLLFGNNLMGRICTV